MKRIISIIAGCALGIFSMPMSAQTPVDLAVRMDDMGAFHSINEAVIKCYNFGIAQSVEVMPVGQWFPEAVKMLQDNPGLDVGIHLTFTSEWENAKWRPLTVCPSLVDKDGYFRAMITKNPNYPGQSIEENPYDIKEVEREFRAQIETVLRYIPWASHLSGHMGSTIYNKELNDLAQRLADEYGLTSLDKTTAQERGYRFASYEGPHKTFAQKEASFIKMLKNLTLKNKPGMRAMFLDHPCLDNDEMRTIFHIGYEDVLADRVGVTELFTSEKVKQTIKELNINLIPVSALTKSLPRAKNKEMASAINNYLAKATEAGLDVHSIMVLQHGKVVGEKWLSASFPGQEHIMNSASKTFTSTAVGFAVTEGKLKLTDKVISFFPDKLPAKVSDNLKQMTVRDLLTMTCGQERANTTAQRTYDQDWVEEFLKEPVPYKPGTHYAYNGLGTYMLSAIVTKVTGEKIFDYLQPRLFRPLGIVGATWLESPQGINTGGWGLYLKTEDLAKMGQLYLQKGMWNGKQLIPASWIEEASRKQVESRPAGMTDAQLKNIDPTNNDWMQGYGYQIWQGRHNTYRADGANGQYILVLPEQDAVVAMTANLQNMAKELDLVWDVILPALK